jgi:nicotinamidase-related amidase
MPPCRHAAMPRRFCLGLRYSCFAGGADLESHLHKLGIEEVVITGINTDRGVGFWNST